MAKQKENKGMPSVDIKLKEQVKTKVVVSTEELEKKACTKWQRDRFAWKTR